MWPTALFAGLAAGAATPAECAIITTSHVELCTLICFRFSEGDVSAKKDVGQTDGKRDRQRDAVRVWGTRVV